MQDTVNTIIDENKCTGCGLCVNACPVGTLAIIDKKAKVVGDTSLNCGHCEAACPHGAIKVTTLDELQFKTFDLERKWLKYGKADVSELVRLMASRRSCRKFKDEAISRDVLEDLVKIGTTAPSGSNAQEWTFTIIDERKRIDEFIDKIAGFFRGLNRLSEKNVLRKILKLAGKKELDHYYNKYHDRIEGRLEEYDKSRKDFLFHGARSLILVGATAKASTGSDDSLLAAQNIMLAAHAMGFGTCLIGFAVMAIARDNSIRNFLGLKKGERIFAVIALGKPDENYSKIITRKKITPGYL